MIHLPRFPCLTGIPETFHGKRQCEECWNDCVLSIAPAMSLFLGLDVGTQGTKAIVYDDARKAQVAQARVSYPVLKTSVPNRAEQHPHTWVDACVSTVQSVVGEVDSSAIKAIGVSGQQHGLVALDSLGEVIRPAKLWCDLESAKEAEQLSKAFGWTIVPGFTAPKILWLKNNEPDNFAKLSQVLLPHDFINFVLTGEYAMECGDASGTGVFDTPSRKFRPDHMAAIDAELDRKFPRLIEPNDVVGTVKPEMADVLGVGEDVIVAPGSGDNMMSALGAGAVSDGVMVLSLGTSGTLFGCSSTPIVDRSGAIAPFCDATGKWLPLLCTMSCTGALEEVREMFSMDHDALTELAEQESPGCDGVNFLPYLTGERTPNWPHATGTIVGLRPGMLRPGVIYRAAMEGATFTLLAGLKRMQELGLKPKELRVVGGGSKNRLWRRIIADSFQLPLTFPVEPESAALGAALQAGAVLRGVPVAEYVEEQSVALSPDVVQPDPKLKQQYEEAFDLHQSLGQLLFGNGI